MQLSTQEVISLVAIVFPLVVSLATAAYQRMLESLPSNKRALVKDVVDTAVHAVEQMYNNMDGVSPADKKAKAVEFVEAALKNMHISIPGSLVDALIEESVFYLNQQKQSDASSPVHAQVGFTPPQK